MRDKLENARGDLDPKVQEYAGGQQLVILHIISCIILNLILINPDEDREPLPLNTS